MVDLTPGADGRPRARLLDLVPGRSGKAYGDWLDARGETFRAGVKEATLDPFHGYKNAIDDHLDDAVAVLDAFHVVKLGTQAVDEVRRRVQHDICGHRGRAGDPLYGIRSILRSSAERLSDRQTARLAKAIAADERHDEVHIALAGRPEAALRVRRHQPRRGTPDRRRTARRPALLPDPRDRPPRQDPHPLAGRLLGLLHHRTGQQRRDRGHQRAHRAPPPNRTRLSQPGQLPAPHAPHRGRPHPPHLK